MGMGGMFRRFIADDRPWLAEQMRAAGRGRPGATAGALEAQLASV